MGDFISEEELNGLRFWEALRQSKSTHSLAGTLEK